MIHAVPILASWVLPIMLAILALLILGALIAMLIQRTIKQRNMDRWIKTYIREARRRDRPELEGPHHVLICVADHYEPMVGKPPPDQAMSRVQAWVNDYPKLFGEIRDSDGRPPRHSFFFPIDEYDPAHVDGIAGLCRKGFGEVEIHLHHDWDTPEGLTKRLDRFTRLFRERHGVLPADRKTGAGRFGFIHGNWALDNSRPDGRWCGVNNELDILRDAGCYADFTLPSAPSPTQTRKINSIYYARDNPQQPKSHDWGVDIGVGEPPSHSLMLIQGPLVLNWRSRKLGIMPRVENGCLQHGQAPTMRRLDLWMNARVHVPSRPDWYFIKLHTHGAPERNQEVLLGEPMVRFHKGLKERAVRDKRFHYHYVTAREMYNLARAAEAGWKGTVADARDYELVWAP